MYVLQSARVLTVDQFGQYYVRKVDDNSAEALFGSVAQPDHPRPTVITRLTEPLH